MCEVLCVVISRVAFSWPPVYLEVSLFCAVLEPIESYIYIDLDRFCLICFVGGSYGCGVFNFYWGWGLLVFRIN